MPVVEGVERVREYRKKKAALEKSGLGQIPELFGKLRNDGDMAIMRILTDNYAMATMHNFYDEGMKRKIVAYCPGKPDCEMCEDTENRAVDWFAFWVWVYAIYHSEKDNDKEWAKVKRNGITYYKETVDGVMLARRGIGKGGGLWESFDSIYKAHGTWTDRDIQLVRSGEGLDTVFTPTALDKSSLTPRAAKVIGKLPSLKRVMVGEVKSLESIAEKKLDSKKGKLKKVDREGEEE
jgi:hypothetical protein